MLSILTAGGQSGFVCYSVERILAECIAVQCGVVPISVLQYSVSLCRAAQLSVKKTCLSRFAGYVAQF